MDTIYQRLPQTMWVLGLALILGVLIAVPVALPIAAVLSAGLMPAGDAWTHIRENLLAEYVVNTVLLMLACALLPFSLSFANNFFGFGSPDFPYTSGGILVMLPLIAYVALSLRQFRHRFPQGIDPHAQVVGRVAQVQSQRGQHLVVA